MLSHFDTIPECDTDIWTNRISISTLHISTAVLSHDKIDCLHIPIHNVIFCQWHVLTWPNSAYPSAQLGNLRIVDSKASINEPVSVTLFNVARRKSTLKINRTNKENIKTCKCIYTTSEMPVFNNWTQRPNKNQFMLTLMHLCSKELKVRCRNAGLTAR